MRATEKIVAAAGLAVALGGGAMSAYAPSLFPQYAAVGFWGGGGVLIVGAAVTVWALTHRVPRQTTEAHVGDKYNNFGNNFGHMGPINIGNPAFELTQAHINEVLSHLIPGWPVIVQAVGNQRAWGMGNAMANAIGAAGHTVVQQNIGILSPPPEGPLTVSHEGNTTCVTIAPSA